MINENDNTFESDRPLLFSIAYRMLGSAMDAEDIVQEAFLRYQSAANIEMPKAFLTSVVTRLCLDQLKSARAQRESYIGPWLPEPLITSASLLYNEYEFISLAFLVLLESLTPVERAVFLLREVFDYDYRDIADIVDKEEAACRQSFHRAKATSPSIARASPPRPKNTSKCWNASCRLASWANWRTSPIYWQRMCP
ncbi:MAG: sigma-70 family RNA polymerase sigma factor [Luteolibacter sp.]